MLINWKKKLLSAFWLFIVTLSISGYEFAWPIEDGEIGDGILKYPTDEIYNIYFKDNEPYGEYLITADEGTNILSPCDGVIVHVLYGLSISYLTMFGDDDLDNVKEKAGKIGMDEKYVCYNIGIRRKTGETVCL